MARPRGNYAVTAARREAILAAALEIFGSVGYNGSSLKQVAEVVGMTEAGILHHFGSKSNLLVQVLQTRDDQTAKYIPTGLTNPLDFVSGWLKIVRYNLSRPGIVELFAKVSAEATTVGHPAHEHFKARYALVQDFNFRHFTALSEGGYLDTDADPRGLAIALVAISDGLQIQWLMNPEISIDQELGRFFRDILTEEAWTEVEFSLLGAVANY